MGTLNDQIKQIDRRTLPLIRIGEVVDVYDPKRTGRIKVRLEGIDKDDVTVTSLPDVVAVTPEPTKSKELTAVVRSEPSSFTAIEEPEISLILSSR